MRKASKCEALKCEHDHESLLGSLGLPDFSAGDIVPYVLFYENYVPAMRVQSIMGEHERMHIVALPLNDHDAVVSKNCLQLQCGQRGPGGRRKKG
jgi:hypothetical protein